MIGIRSRDRQGEPRPIAAGRATCGRIGGLAPILGAAPGALSRPG